LAATQQQAEFAQAWSNAFCCNWYACLGNTCNYVNETYSICG
jgi:hypothetical protein